MIRDNGKTIELDEKTEKANRKAAKKVALRNLSKLRKQIKKNKLAPERADARVAASVEPIGERLPYPGGFPVYLSRYVILGGVAPRVAMRFFNASDILVTGLRFRLTEKDKDGKILAEYDLERFGLFAERGGEFAVTDALVNPECVLVEAKLEMVRSDNYEYAVGEDGDVTLRYGSTSMEPEIFFKERPTYSVKKRGVKYVIVSILAVILVTVAAGAAAWRMGILEKVEISDSADSAQITCMLRDKDENVEAQRYN